MRYVRLLPLLPLLLVAAACSDTTSPERRSLIGLWTSEGFTGAAVTLTLTETARNVTGTGRWVGPQVAEGFRVAGTHAEQSVSLIFDFSELDDVNFLGQFTDDDVLEGTLVGSGLRGEAITLRRLEER